MTTTTRTAASRRMTTTITRDGLGIDGPRLVADDASTLCVTALPFTDIAMAVAGGAFDTPGAYILNGVSPADGMPAAYVGESGRLGRRLQEHAATADSV